ncbi:MAG: hypothetical protein R2710_27775 [Acidimicrobiales bacterium]
MSCGRLGLIGAIYDLVLRAPARCSMSSGRTIQTAQSGSSTRP